MGFKKIFRKILGKKEDEVSLIQLGDQLKGVDLDYKFAQLFTHSGGYFNYCASEEEALKVLHKILKSEAIESVFCCDEQLHDFLDVLKASYTSTLELSNDCAFITCEYLIAYDGKVMLSYENIRHYPSSSLPEKIIVMATISQIVGNLDDAMMKIKRKGAVKNLTSISGKGSQISGLQPAKTKLFLLLLEDQE